MSNAKGTPLTAAIIVTIAVLILGGLAFTFQGSVMF